MTEEAISEASAIPFFSDDCAMPEPSEFDRLRQLIVRSKQLKKEAAILDARIQEALNAMRSEAGAAKLDTLAAEVETADVREITEADIESGGSPNRG